MNAPALSGDTLPGSRTYFGKYIVIRQLGSGGMAQVFEGQHPELGCRVALKALRPAIAPQTRASARFLREAKAAAQIRHPNVVRVLDIGTHADMPFIVMEFLEGEDLSTLLIRKGPLRLGSIVELFLPIISAVATAHANGIIHRDLKPANLMLTSRPPHGTHPFVLDFGISKIAGDDAEGTLTGSESLLGTVQYMAPELTRGAKFASAQSDQYALGAMLYECATGRRPFSGRSHYELMHAIVTSPIIPPSELCPSLSPEFDAIALRAMAREPGQRFPSVHALGTALLALAEASTWALWRREFLGAGDALDLWSRESPTLTDAPSRSTSVPARRGRRTYRRWGIPALVALTGVAAGWLIRRPPVLVPPLVHAAMVPPAATAINVIPEPVVDRDQPPGALSTNQAEVALTSLAIPTAPADQAPASPPPTPESKAARSATAPGRGESAATPTLTAEPPPLTRGTNGALIIE